MRKWLGWIESPKGFAVMSSFPSCFFATGPPIVFIITSIVIPCSLIPSFLGPYAIIASAVAWFPTYDSIIIPPSLITITSSWSLPISVSPTSIKGTIFRNMISLFTAITPTSLLRSPLSASLVCRALVRPMPRLVAFEASVWAPILGLVLLSCP